jgi:DNA polymerase-3 subunit alpha
MPQLLMKGDYEGAKRWAQEMKDVFGDDFYIELQDHGIMEERQVLPDLIKIARELDIQLVATNDVHYIQKSDWERTTFFFVFKPRKRLPTPSV